VTSVCAQCVRFCGAFLCCGGLGRWFLDIPGYSDGLGYFERHLLDARRECRRETGYLVALRLLGGLGRQRALLWRVREYVA
jgi:hypothetical protein